MSDPTVRIGENADNFDRLLASSNITANTLLTTLLVDVIWPLGGQVWLGHLIGLAKPFGLTERLVRTGVYRLSRDDWLQSTSRGRRAIYDLAESGRARIENEQPRLYAAADSQWDGRWRLVQLLPALSPAERKSIRRELKALGFGQIGPTLLAHPSIGSDILRTVLERLELSAKILAFDALTEDFVAMETARAMVRSAWDLGEINASYEGFLDLFSALEEQLASARPPSIEAAYRLRILLIYNYRRLMFKDPQLPDTLLPATWAGGAAGELCARLYRRLARPANEYVARVLQIETGENLPLNSEFWMRFNGPDP